MLISMEELLKKDLLSYVKYQEV